MITLVYEAHEPCGCGSNKPFGKCCLRDGSVKLREKSAHPPGPKTGISCPKCLFASENDCCGQMSGDHFISRSVLKVLSPMKIGISGAHGTHVHSLDSSSLKTKRLCRRHNTALSPIDAEAGRFFSAFAAINDAMTGRAPAQRLFLFHGTDLERWLLKTAVMTYYCGASEINPRTARLPAGYQDLFHYTLPQPYGLYFRCGSSLGQFTTEGAVTVALSTLENELAGVTVTLGGLELRLLLARPSATMLTQLTYRPTTIGFVNPSQAYAIAIAYAEPGDRSVWISREPCGLEKFAGIYGAAGRIGR